METSKILQEGLTELKLKYWGQALIEDMEKMKEPEAQLISKYLVQWITKEKAERRTSMIQSKIRTARFRRVQTVENFDFRHSKTSEKVEQTYLTLHKGVAKDNLPSAVFTGNAGTGKTHLARALGYAACQKGLSVLFITAAEMVNHLQHAQKTYSLESELQKYRKPQVLIIDELGYVALDTQASNLFFQVISSRHDAELGTIATTNLPFGKFNQIFANDAIAHAIVDRLVNEAEVFYMEGDSYRPHQRQEKLKRKKQNA
jgi:DNA replication protein DnaC